MKLSGPSLLSVMKYLPQARHGLLAPLESIVNDWGDSVRIPFPGDPVYFFRSPEGIQSFLQENDECYRRSYDDLKKFMGEGLITSDGASWKKQRRFIAPMFHGPVIAGFFNLMTEEASCLSERLKSQADASGHVKMDVEKEMLDVTLRIVTRCLISSDLQEQGERLSKLMGIMMEHVVARLRSPVRLPFTWPTPGSRRFYRALTELNSMIYALIEQRRKNGGAPSRDLLDLLLDIKDENNERMSEQMVRDEVVTFVLAGHETTAHALTWGMDLLARHPAEVTRLTEELDGVDFNSMTLLKMPVLNQIYREILRLYPPVWYIERVSIKAHKVLDFDIPEGVRVAVSPYLTHRDPKLWKNPNSFEPRRFEKLSNASDSRWSWIPYGAGPRSCIGQPMALMQFQTVLARMIKDFAITGAPPPAAINPLITLRPREAIVLSLKRRDHL